MKYELPSVSESSFFFRSLKFIDVLPAQNTFSFDASGPVQTREPPEAMVSRRVFQHNFWKWVFYVDGTTPFSVATAWATSPATARATATTTTTATATATATAK